MEELNLASAELGTKVLYATDEWFAPAPNLLKPGRGIFIPDKFTENGKWMDGWETRRHGSLTRGGRDSCYIKLAHPCYIESVDLDTNHFTGNFVEAASIHACNVDGDPAWFYLADEEVAWQEIVPKTDLKGGSEEAGGHNVRPSVVTDKPFTHLRLDVFPDGGIARLKILGRICPLDPATADPKKVVNLLAAGNGARALSCSNMHYSSPWNLLLESQAENMASGWETRRSRGKDARDWAILAMCCPGAVDAIEVDTSWFKGNFPHTFTIEGANLKDTTAPLSNDEESKLVEENTAWTTILKRTPGKAHSRMIFRGSDLSDACTKPGSDVFTHIKLTVFPDGGVSRLRLYGYPRAPRA